MTTVTTSARAELRAPRAELDRMTAELSILKSRTGHALYEMGVRFLRVQDEQLWRAGSFASFEEYVEREVDVARSTAYKLMRVAREFNAAIAERYGVEKLELGLRYLDATPADERPGDLVACDVRVRDERGRRVSIPFHSAKTRQIREAIALLEDARRRVKRIPAALAKRAEQLASAMPAAPAGTTAGKRVRMRKAADGRIATTFAAVPLDDLDAFLKAVRVHLL